MLAYLILEGKVVLLLIIALAQVLVMVEHLPLAARTHRTQKHQDLAVQERLQELLQAPVVQVLQTQYIAPLVLYMELVEVAQWRVTLRLLTTLATVEKVDTEITLQT
jgi:hypothetical protein